MKLEFKDWVRIVILLCLGFILGRLTVPPGAETVTARHDVHPGLQGLEIGGYQLTVAEIDLPHMVLDNRGKVIGHEALTSGKTLFRIDTVTGDVDYYSQEIIRSWGDTLITSEHEWYSLTRTKATKTKLD